MVAKRRNFSLIFMNQFGFTFIELMIAFIVISIIAMVAIPSYQSHITDVARGDMMIELQNRASILESRKTLEGSYSDLKTDDKNLLIDLELDYPTTGEALYTVVISPMPLTSQWTITATPISGKRMEDDGALSVSFQGIKCRVLGSESKCGTGEQWRK